MSITLNDLIAQVNLELQNIDVRGSADATADGETSSFLVAPIGCTILDDATFSVTLDGVAQVENTHYTMDFANGVCTMVTVPTNGQVLEWQFNYVAFTDELITSAINAGIGNLFPAIYVTDITTVASDGTAYEFQLAAGSEFVTKMQFKGTGSTDRYSKLRRHLWELDSHGVDKIVHFYTPPPQGTLRVHTILRPVSVTDVPDRVAPALVSYACYYLLVQKMAPRVRADVAVATQGTGNVYPVQMNQVAQAFMMRYQFQLSSVKMPPWSAV